MLTGDTKETIVKILYGMNIDLESPEQLDFDQEEDDEMNGENPIQDDDDSFNFE
jgi:hypothetical protein